MISGAAPLTPVDIADYRDYVCPMVRRQLPHTPDEEADPTAGTRPYLLPADLPKALTWLSAAELEALLAAAHQEQRRRSDTAEKPSSVAGNAALIKPSNSLGPRIGQINAIRAALRAGVKPGMVARQFQIV